MFEADRSSVSLVISAILMGTLSHAITPKLALPGHDFSSSSSSYYGLTLPSYLNSRFQRSNSTTRLAKKIRVSAKLAKHSPAVDFSDPEWKSKFEKEFETRFNIPHITDVFDDAVSIPSTFCLRMRSASLSLSLSQFLLSCCSCKHT